MDHVIELQRRCNTAFIDLTSIVRGPYSHQQKKELSLASTHTNQNEHRTTTDNLNTKTLLDGLRFKTSNGDIRFQMTQRRISTSEKIK